MNTNNCDMKVAIVHDYLNQRGGAERVVCAFHEIFPDAPIFTSIVDNESLWPELKGADIRTTWMQGLPGLKRHFKKYLPLYPRAFESLNVEGYDVILSSSSAFAKGVKKRGALHICYCYTPMRFVWDYERYVEREEMGPVVRAVLPLLIERLRKWDLDTKDNPDYYVAISTVVQERIKRFYNRDSVVIFPPVDAEKFRPSGSVEDFYLIVSRLNPYKKIEVAVEAMNRLKLPLKIIGGGPYRRAIEEMAGPTVEVIGPVGDGELASYYSKCRALIFPGEEDFGIVPLEANASGRPVIALRAGGALDTIEPGTNGIFFEEAAPESLIDALLFMERSWRSFDPARVRAHAMKFDKLVFKERIKKFVREVYVRGMEGAESSRRKSGYA